MDLQLLKQAYQFLNLGQTQMARRLFEQAAHQPTLKAFAANGLGLCAEAEQNFEAAELHYRMALTLHPQHPEYNSNLGLCLKRQGKLEEALGFLIHSARLQPNVINFYNQALIQCQLQQPWQSLRSLAEGLKLKATDELQALLVQVVDLLARSVESFASYQKCIQHSPDEAVWHFGLAYYLEQGQQFEQAAAEYAKAAELLPGLFEALRRLIVLKQRQGEFEQALVIARDLHARQGNAYSLMYLLSSLQTPIAESNQAIQANRQELQALIENFFEQQDMYMLTKYAALTRPAILNFYHVYQGGEDRPLQALLARFYEALSVFLPEPEPREPLEARRPRIGIVSSHLFEHAVMDLLLPALLKLLHYQGFESFVFYPESLRMAEDQITQQFKQMAAHFVYLPEHHIAAAQQIAALELDLLIYPAIGLESFCYMLALQRLAPYQLVLPGHGITTGLKNLDYFISAEIFESEQAQTYYSETLIRLPGLPNCPQLELYPLASRDDLGLPEGHLYFCPMTPFKIQPDFDKLVADILMRDPAAKMLFLKFEGGLHLKLLERFHGHYPHLSERLLFLPWSSRSVFFQRLMAVDVVLDSFPFGGGTTAYQLMGLACPTVTLDVPWHKGRWSAGMYRLMGLSELIASDQQAYVELALKLANEPDYNQAIREQIQARNHVLFNQDTWSQALLDFCLGLFKQT